MEIISGPLEKIGLENGQPTATIAGRKVNTSVEVRTKLLKIPVGSTVHLAMGKVPNRTGMFAVQVETGDFGPAPDPGPVNTAPPVRETPPVKPSPQEALNLPAVTEIRHVHVPVPELNDSIEIGTPGKGGVLKVRFNAADPAEADRLIRSAYERLQLARELMDSDPPAPKNGSTVLGGKKNGEVINA
jgi:hypothetical protein